MAELVHTKGDGAYKPPARRVVLTAAGSYLFATESLAANATMGRRTAPHLALTASGAARDAAFLAEVEEDGAYYVIYNAGATYNVVVKNSAAATIATLLPGEWIELVYDVSAWAVLRRAQAATMTTISPTTISLTDNLATALDITEGANSFLKFTTTNSGEKVVVGKALDVDNASVDVSTQATVLSIKDNEAAALDISEGSNVYLRCVTTNSGEQVVIGKPVLHAGGIAPASLFSSTEQTGTGSAQNVAHGLGSTPSLVWFAVSEDPAGIGFDVALGAHGATNCVFTVTSGVKFFAYALK